MFCIGEFVRLVTHRRVLNPPSTLAQALSFLERVLASPTCRIVRPGPEFVDLFAETVSAASARGNLVFDAQIAALCRISTILTNDRDFRRFDHLRVRVPGEPA
ncbi:MAG: PIN domain-containing protein [Gammaproteobacteria bacterium]|nr:PIN domain-containing protein [Gammaproteobacteria bacterium]